MRKLKQLAILIFIAFTLSIPFIRVAHSSSMPSMDHTTMPSPTASSIKDCVSACTVSGHLPLNLIDLRQSEKQKDPEPTPAEPYYLAFIGVGWTTILTVAAAYLLKYLRWRPPDIYKLNLAYRF